MNYGLGPERAVVVGIKGTWKQKRERLQWARLSSALNYDFFGDGFSLITTTTIPQTSESFDRTYS